MKIFDITNSELFENLIFISDYDIHNDYEVKKINFSHHTNFEIILKNIHFNNEIIINFVETEFIEFELPLFNLTIDNFYRGRYEFNNQLFDEFRNKKCFYMEFCDIGQISLLCTSASVSG